jgi:calcium-dependent protein kinase
MSNPDELNNVISFNKETFVSQNFGSIFEKYDIIKSLGSGSFGKVYQIKNKISNNIYACKELSKKKIKKKDLEKFATEIKILRKSDHPNIVKIYEIYEDEHKINLIMEECTGGELFDDIVTHIEDEKMYSEKEACLIFKQLMGAIAYCHSQGIAHRDLKPENILFLNKSDDSPIKVIDFGLSKIFGDYFNKNNNKMNTKVGTAYYVSPEVLEGIYDEKCDIWSAGVILYILLSGVPPFNGPNDNEIYKKICKKKFHFPDKHWSNISNDAKDLITKMLCDPMDRLTAQEVLQHIWVDKNAPNTIGYIDNLNINHLKKYCMENKLKKAVLTFIASRLKDNEIQHLKEIFNEVDTNKDGTITFEEMKTGLCTAFSDSKYNIEELFKNFDTDNTGTVGYTEFITATIEQYTYMKQEKLLEAFKTFDKDNSGKISKEEIKNTLKLNFINSDLLQIYIDKFDLNGDGEIDYYEFLEMMGH